jgi:ABC-type branched-subunit amino acid transport system substrate-binding protein
VLSRVLAWGRTRVHARTLLSVATMVPAAVGGCSAAGSSSVKVSGTKLTIYSSIPRSQLATDPGTARDIQNAEQLALEQNGSQVGKFKISFVQLGDDKLSNNARTAISDTTAIAYLGELAPGASADSMGILNAQDLLQVSPSDTAIELTQATPAVPGAPGNLYESLKTYGRTFARVTPNAAHEAKAQVAEMHTLGVKQLYVTDDGSPYGKAIAHAVRQDAASPAVGITVSSSQSGADAIFFGAGDVQGAIHSFTSAAQSNPTAKLFGPSALDNTTFAGGIASAAKNVYISSPGFLPADLTPGGQTFVSDFKDKYGHAPATGAIFGYEAMRAVLNVLKKAGTSANSRGTVVDDFFSYKNAGQPTALPSYSINANGDTSLAQFVFSRLRAGRLVPFVSIQG